MSCFMLENADGAPKTCTKARPWNKIPERSNAFFCVNNTKSGDSN